MQRRVALTIALTAFAADAVPLAAEEELWEEHPHHLSFLLSGTYEEEEDEDETAASFGIDYEYRLNRLIGIGAVVERAFNPIDATTFLAVADIHLWRGLCIQTGPGIEAIDADGEEESRDLFVYRIGALYEIEMERFTVSPQLHYDNTDEVDALIFGVAVGFAF